MPDTSALILAPHIDDEILGCFAFLNEKTHILYFGVEERPDASAVQRILEMETCQKVRKFSWQLKKFEVNRYPAAELISPIEECINRLRPATILLPYPSYNQDHRAVHQAALVALRPHDRNHFVKQVLIYEQPHTYLWPESTFHPNYFVPIDIEEKIDLYASYKTQVRGHRSPNILRAMAVLRGAQADNPFAEGYQCIRYVSK